jgi:hypothetical protein
MVGKLAVLLGLAATALITTATASASPNALGTANDGARTPPVLLNGPYVMTTALDRQTFNGAPSPAIPFASEVSFTTTCDAAGCVAHSSLSARDVPFDFHWTGSEWESAQRMQWTCEGDPAPATMTITLMPKGNGTLSGVRSAVVGGPGCGSPRVPGTVVAPVTVAPA